MKIPLNQIESFLTKVPEECFGILLYGPNRGLSSIRSTDLKSFWMDGSIDPFAIKIIESNSIIRNPQILYDAVSGLS